MYRNTRRAGLLLATASCLTLAHSAHAQETADSATEAYDQAFVADTVIVTGTRQAQRTVFNSLAPIDVVTSDAIDSTQSEDLLDTVAQLVPSFKVQRLPMADGRIFVRPATLRGLSPDHTLVLVNGKRRHRSAVLGSDGEQAPDLATIPSFAIKRIEVLRDGASAQYGSDAIAGVINIILDDAPGYSAFGQYSQYYEGDGTNYQFGGQAGWELGEDGFLVATAEYYDAERTSRSRQRLDALEFGASNPGVELRDPVQNWGQPERTATRLAVNGQIAATENVEGYFFGTYTEGEGLSDFNWRNPASSSAFRSSPAFPEFDLRTIYPAGFSPQFGQDDTDLSVVGGLRGDAYDGAFSWDFSLGYGRNTVDYLIFNTINASLGPDSPTSFRPGVLEQQEFNINADFVYVADWGMADNVNIAFGAESREEVYEKGVGDEASYAIGPGAAQGGLPTGSNGFRGFGPQESGEFEQKSYAAYGDIELPVTSALTLGAAVRFEDYSAFGDTFDYKLSTRYEVTPDFAVRATASTGFRAPTPAQLFSEETSQGLDSTTLDIFTAGRFSPEGPVADIIAQRGGVDLSALVPEESENYTIGFTYRNDFGFNASVDLYHIEITDRFGESENFFLTDDERTQLAAAGVPGAVTFTRVDFFQNDFDTETQGVDVVATYTTDLGSGDLTFTSAYNYNSTEVTGGELVDNETAKRVFEEELPQHTGNLTATYAAGPFEVFGRVRYYGEWTDRSGNSDGDVFQEFGAQTFFDVGLTYHFTDDLSARIGAENIFDQYPDEATRQANRGLIYSRNAPYDTDGGSYYIRLDAKF